MATILAHITIREGGEADFEAIARELYAATHEHETGVNRYEYWRGAEPRQYYTLLAFDDFNTFIGHQTSDHHEDASPNLGKVIESIRLEWVDPIADAAPLPPTNAQDAPPDASELFVEYHARYGIQVADWWHALR